MTGAAQRPRLVCLLVVQDAADRLPAWFDAVRGFADGVVVLDRGSTDGTAAVLEREPLVTALLTADGSGAGTAPDRLLEAADAVAPDWLLWLELDEHVPPEDTGALRAFLERDALPGYAYGFQTAGAEQVFRVFAHDAGQPLPEATDSGDRVPTSIPRSRRLATTLRLAPLVAGPADRRSRGRAATVLEAAAGGEVDWGAPVISAVVISRDDEDRIESVVRALVEQECPDAFEVIVVTSGTDRTAAIVRDRFPQVQLVALARPALPGEARNAGLAVARGDYLTFPGSHVVLPPGSLAARVRAHEHGYPLVTGTTLNGTRTWAGWATYFLDHTTLLPRRPSGVLHGPPSHCSYLRELLVAVGGFPEDMRAGEDTVVNLELTRRGYRAYRAQDVRMIHHSPCRTPARLVRHHVARGRAMGRIELDRAGPGRLLAPGAAKRFGFGYVLERLRATTANVRRWGQGLCLAYAWSLPLVTLGAIAAWGGFWYEILGAVRGRLRPVELGFAGAEPRSPHPPGEPEERAHAGAALAVLYPLHERHPALARVPAPLRRFTRRALTRLAVGAHLHRCRDVSLLAVTGSAGKTTTKDLLGQILAGCGPTVRTRHNDNGLWGVPATLLAIRPSDRFAVIELGIKGGPGEMSWMAGLFRPHVAVLTGIGEYHVEEFGSPAAIALEKRALLERLGSDGTAIVNADDPLARACAAGLPCRVLLAGRGEDADVRLLTVRSAWPHGLDLELAIGTRFESGRVGVHGEHLAILAVLAIAAAEAAGVPAELAMDAAGAFAPRIGRLAPAPGPRGSLLIVDDWKSRVPSAVAGVRSLGATGGGRRIAVLGEVQVDAQTRDTYRPIADVLPECADRLIAVGRCGAPLAELLAGTALGAEMLCVPDADAAATALAPELGPGDIVLLHGSGDHDLEGVQLLLDADTDADWIRDWRRRPALRVGRPVAEVNAYVDAAWGGGATADVLTYVAVTGHRLGVDGSLVPADDRDVLAWARRSAAAPLMVVGGAHAGSIADARSRTRLVEQALRHCAAAGYRGVLLDLSAVGPALRAERARLLERAAERCGRAGLWLFAVLPAQVDLDAAHAAPADRVLVDAAMCLPDLWARVPRGKVLLNAGAEPGVSFGAALALVREHGLRGVSLPRWPASVASLELLEHRCQLRKRGSRA